METASTSVSDSSELSGNFALDRFQIRGINGDLIKPNLGDPSPDWVSYTEHIIVPYPDWEEALRRIQRLLKYSGKTREPRGMELTGLSGVGKTRLAEYVWSLNCPFKEGNWKKMPILLFPLPDKPTRGSTVRAALRELGDPAYNRGRDIDEFTDRLIDLLQPHKCATRLLFVDEITQVLDRANRNVAPELAEWIKIFWRRCPIPIVLIGLPHATDFLKREENAQLRERFKASYEIKPLPWKQADGNHGFLFASWHHKLDTLQPYPLFGLGHPEPAELMWRATKGRPRRSLRILCGAIEEAVERGAERLEARDFELGFDMAIQTYPEDFAKEDLPESNPFQWWHWELPKAT